MPFILEILISILAPLVPFILEISTGIIQGVADYNKITPLSVFLHPLAIIPFLFSMFTTITSAVGTIHSDQLLLRTGSWCEGLCRTAEVRCSQA